MSFILYEEQLVTSKLCPVVPEHEFERGRMLLKEAERVKNSYFKPKWLLMVHTLVFPCPAYIPHSSHHGTSNFASGSYLPHFCHWIYVGGVDHQVFFPRPRIEHMTHPWLWNYILLTPLHQNLKLEQSDTKTSNGWHWLPWSHPGDTRYQLLIPTSSERLWSISFPKPMSQKCLQFCELPCVLNKLLYCLCHTPPVPIAFNQIILVSLRYFS